MNDNMNNAPEKNFFKGITEKTKGLNKEKIRTAGLFRRGGYAFTITVIVLAVVVLLNYLVSVVNKRVNLEIDMTKGNQNTISKENEKYIRSVSEGVEVIVCGTKSGYVANLGSYCQSKYRVAGSDTYFSQTLFLISKYDDYNKNINVKYVDPSSTEYTAITQQYPSVELGYGDIIVRKTEQSQNAKYKHLGFSDIYEIYDPSGYASYGYDMYAVNGNKLENALSGAISYVLSEKTYKVGLLNGHSTTDNSGKFKTMLSENNIVTEEIKGGLVTEISSDYDAVAIVTPTKDFIESETDALTEYLDNDGLGGKGLIYFADATMPALPNLYDFLSEWGIAVEEGVLFETNAQYIPTENERSALYVVPTGKSAITKNMNGFITGFNVPMTVCDPADSDIKVNEVAATTETVYAAPVGTGDDLGEIDANDCQEYSGIIEAQKSGSKGVSYVYAFGSIEYIDSDWAEISSLSNKEVVLAAVNRCCGVDEGAFSFANKSLTSESFANEITTSDSQRIKNIFMYFIPIIMVIWGIVVFIRRRNSR